MKPFGVRETAMLNSSSSSLHHIEILAPAMSLITNSLEVITSALQFEVGGWWHAAVP